MSLPPLAPPIRGLWAPSVLYEAHNPRQRTRLDLYSSASTSNQVRKDVEAKYAAKRDLVNVLRASTSRMVWDYAAEAATLSDEEAAFEAEYDSARHYGWSWLVPEGKLTNQEGEQEDEAIQEEARQIRAQAAAEADPANADETQAGDPAVDVARAGRQSRRRRQQSDRERSQNRPERTRRSGGTAEGARSARRSGGRTSDTRNAPANRAPNSRESVGTTARALPRTSNPRYSISSSNGSGGGSGAAALPRYAGAMRRTSSSGVGSSAPGMAANSSIISVASAAGPSGSRAGGRDLDAEIPEAEERSYGGDGSGQLDRDLDGDLTDLDELDPENRENDMDEESDDDVVHVRSSRLVPSGSQTSPRHTLPRIIPAENEENENDDDSTDMDLSN